MWEDYKNQIIQIGDYVTPWHRVRSVEHRVLKVESSVCGLPVARNIYKEHDNLAWIPYLLIKVPEGLEHDPPALQLFLALLRSTPR